MHKGATACGEMLLIHSFVLYCHLLFVVLVFTVAGMVDRLVSQIEERENEEDGMMSTL